MAFLFLFVLATESTEFTEEKTKKGRTYRECMQMVKAKPISFSGRERTFGL
jgi:hypothetical protein